MENRTIFIGIAGGTASGKTTVVEKIMDRFKNESVECLELDAYYKDFSHLSPSERDHLNFDHPQSIDFDLLISHIQLLKEGNKIEKPIYDFGTHLRTSQTVTITPRKIVIVEGILIFSNSKIRELLDMKIFVDAAPDIRLMRRIERDMTERGRSLESVKAQYFKTVRPMHLEFIEPTKQYADIIVPRGGDNHVAISMIRSRIRYLLEK
ncbi:MAG: uridine kinase [Fusobacteria bacterium]|nr:uridine kinase [Fusobacteriota bacterium]